MGISSDGILSYGYNLGSPEDWALDPMLSDADEIMEEEDFEDVVNDLLLAGGITDIKVVCYCSCEYPMYTLVAKKYTCYRGDCIIPDLTIQAEWIEKLDRALDVLRIKPFQERPAWILTSMYG